MPVKSSAYVPGGWRRARWQSDNEVAAPFSLAGADLLVVPELSSGGGLLSKVSSGASAIGASPRRVEPSRQPVLRFSAVLQQGSQDALARSVAGARRAEREVTPMPGANITVCVCAGAGGTGRTLVATNLAAALHQQRRGKTLLVDAHYPLPGDGPSQLGVDRAKSLADLTPIVARLTPELITSYLITSPSGISVLPYVNSYLQHSLLTPGLIQAVLEVARVAYDTVVVDLPTEGTGALQTVLDQADVTCVVVELSPSGGVRARSTLDLLRALQFPLERVIGCANRVANERALDADRPAALGGLPIRAVLPEDPRAVRDAAARRQPIVLADPRHAISREIDRLSRDIMTTSTRQLASGVREVDANDVEGAIRKLKLSLHSRLVDEIDIKKADFDMARDAVRMQELRTRVEAKILTLLEEEGRQIRDRQVRRKIVKAVLDEALGLGPLEDLLNDADDHRDHGRPPRPDLRREERQADAAARGSPTTSGCAP